MKTSVAVLITKLDCDAEALLSKLIKRDLI